MTNNTNAAAIVLLFSSAAKPELAARLHSGTCAMVNTAKPLGRNPTKIIRIDNPTAEDIAEIDEQGYPVKKCKCCK